MSENPINLLYRDRQTKRGQGKLKTGCAKLGAGSSPTYAQTLKGKKRKGSCKRSQQVSVRGGEVQGQVEKS